MNENFAVECEEKNAAPTCLENDEEELAAVVVIAKDEDGIAAFTAALVEVGDESECFAAGCKDKLKFDALAVVRTEVGSED